MIQTIIRKVVRLLRFDGRLQMKLGGIIVLLILMAVQRNILKKQEEEAARIGREMERVEKIPEMEKKVGSKDIEGLTPEKQIAAIKGILEGTSYRYGVYHAIIDGEVYSTGSKIGNFTIGEITMREITLEDKERGDVQKLSFPEDQTGEPPPAEE